MLWYCSFLFFSIKQNVYMCTTERPNFSTLARYLLVRDRHSTELCFVNTRRSFQISEKFLQSLKKKGQVGRWNELRPCAPLTQLYNIMYLVTLYRYIHMYNCTYAYLYYMHACSKKNIWILSNDGQTLRLNDVTLRHGAISLASIWLNVRKTRIRVNIFLLLFFFCSQKLLFSFSFNYI